MDLGNMIDSLSLALLFSPFFCITLQLVETVSRESSTGIVVTVACIILQHFDNMYRNVRICGDMRVPDGLNSRKRRIFTMLSHVGDREKFTS